MPSAALASRHEASGKVRELYRLGDELLLVASDRISAYDVVLPTPIPDKGRVLTGLSLFWFERTRELVPNHVLAATLAAYPAEARLPELAGRSMLVRRLRMLPLECVVRGYLAGSGWRDYRTTGAICGHALPAGLRPGERLPRPIFTPATKATSGHDQNVDRRAAAALVGDELLARMERVAIAVYEAAVEHAAGCGIVIADTKLELGLDGDGRLVLGDELLTPDSSRFWPAAAHHPGGEQPSFDKQYVRDWLERQDWDKMPPGPELPADVVRGTRERYVEAYELLAGEPFAAYLERAGAA
jgi:phosphoribosylaminoimidazole-succinocarboxamide synthase